MTLRDVISQWTASLSLEQGLCRSTAAAYAGELSRFTLWAESSLESSLDLETLATTATLKAWLRHKASRRHNAPATIARSIAALKSFFAWIHDEEILTHSPATALRKPKLRKSLPYWLKEHQVHRLVSTARTRNADSADRDLAFVVLLVYTGARVSELVSIRWRDIDWTVARLTLRGKGQNARVIPVSAHALDFLRDYRKRQGRPYPTHIFPGGTSQGHVSVRTVQRAIRRLAHHARISGPLTPHKLRHTYATLLHRHGVRIPELSRLLGHASLTSTQIYLHVDPDDLDHAAKIDLANLPTDEVA